MGDCRSGGKVLPLFLGNAAMNRNTWEIAFVQKPIKLSGSDSALDENDDLVELKLVQEFVKLSILLLFLKLDVILLETVESELGFIIDINLKRRLHKLLANGANLLGKSG